MYLRECACMNVFFQRTSSTVEIIFVIFVGESSTLCLIRKHSKTRRTRSLHIRNGELNPEDEWCL